MNQDELQHAKEVFQKLNENQEQLAKNIRDNLKRLKQLNKKKRHDKDL